MIWTELGNIKLKLWDTMGQEKGRKIVNLFIKGSHCIILGYDITQKFKFDEIKNYHYNNVKEIIVDDSLIFLIANKINFIEDIKVSEKRIFIIQKKEVLNIL